jgi:hypothetical protein
MQRLAKAADSRSPVSGQSRQDRQNLRTQNAVAGSLGCFGGFGKEACHNSGTGAPVDRVCRYFWRPRHKQLLLGRGGRQDRSRSMGGEAAAQARDAALLCEPQRSARGSRCWDTTKGFWTWRKPSVNHGRDLESVLFRQSNLGTTDFPDHRVSGNVIRLHRTGATLPGYISQAGRSPGLQPVSATCVRKRFRMNGFAICLRFRVTR